jgi:hypothetical protein
MAEHPERYRREIDALVLDDLIAILCKQDLYADCFAPALGRAFPQGNEVARTFLYRLVPVRNALSHANPITIHDAERVLCYCDDVVEALKVYYESRNMSKDFNSPTFTRFVDSLGHSEIPTSTDSVYDYSDSSSLRPGDAIRLEVEVDSSFDPDTCIVSWSIFQVGDHGVGMGTSFELTLLPRHVGEKFMIQAILTSNKDWHRHGSYDATLMATYKVLPPLE